MSTKANERRSVPEYHRPLPIGDDKAEYRLLTKEGIKLSRFQGSDVLVVAPEALTLLAREALRDIAFLMRPAHQRQVAVILKDPGASPNDKSIALALLRNSAISAKFELPMCQDTGTATVLAKKGQRVWTGVDDEAYLAAGIRQTYVRENLRYSQTAPLSMYEEVNTGDNLPAQIDIYAADGMEYRFLFLAKGGGSANKTYLYQQTKAILNPGSLKGFLVDRMRSLGTAACPPYHLAFAIGGTSAEACLKAVKLASVGYLDGLPTRGNRHGQAFRDLQLEDELLKEARACGLGAQFGGKHFAHDVRVVRLSRHGASCPVGMGVSCSADRNILARIDRRGVWLEKMERDPGRLIPAALRDAADEAGVPVRLDRPMPELLAELSKHPVTTRLSLTGRLVVARDIAHARLKQRLDRGQGLPQYFKDHPVYYAGPAKTPKGKPAGSFGPTTSGRMDDYVDAFQSRGGSMVMIGKGNRTPQVTSACRKNGGFYLGSAGGVAALLAEKCIRKAQVLDYPELGMEAVWAIDVEDFPAVVLIDDKGHDFYAQLEP